MKQKVHSQFFFCLENLKMSEVSGAINGEIHENKMFENIQELNGDNIDKYRNPYRDLEGDCGH
jgi:hypothetical protein